MVDALLTALAALPGFRPAEAGEFTRRAFLNRKLDLTQAEALADLVRAETEMQRREALRHAGGEARELYEGWRERIVRARALIEAELDFPDEADVPGSVSEEALGDVLTIADEIAAHLDDGGRGERLRDGAEIVILGAPNAGKSTLLNALARRDVAIVAPESGTTRDLIEVRLDLGGYPVTLVDTAGLRDAPGTVEREGVRRALGRAGGADMVLWLEDMAGAPGDPPAALASAVLRVGTKADLVESGAEQSRYDAVISASTGQGLDRLVEAIAGHIRDRLAPREALSVARARHRAALTAARAALLAGLAPGQPLELRAEEFRAASDHLGRITGRVDAENLLDVIFREFCIGK